MLSHPEQAALVSVFMPCELLEAMGVIPMCAEMYSSYINWTQCESVFAETAEGAGIAESYCSYHKILLGSAYAGILPPPKMITARLCATRTTSRSVNSRTSTAYHNTTLTFPRNGVKRALLTLQANSANWRHF